MGGGPAIGKLIPHQMVITHCNTIHSSVLSKRHPGGLQRVTMSYRPLPGKHFNHQHISDFPRFAAGVSTCFAVQLFNRFHKHSQGSWRCRHAHLNIQGLTRVAHETPCASRLVRLIPQDDMPESPWSASRCRRATCTTHGAMSGPWISSPLRKRWGPHWELRVPSSPPLSGGFIFSANLRG